LHHSDHLSAERFGPHALIRDDDGIEAASPDGVVCWVGIIIDDDSRHASA
jgi:hypothetical protein